MKFEVTVTPDYVHDWTVPEAIREILQNALDVRDEHEMSWEYSPEEEVLEVRSLGAELTTQSLLLGATTKSDDTKSVGQFGEGYKLAALVLLRNGLKLTIINGPAGQLWEPRFVKSRRYGCDVLTFFVTKCPKEDNLTFRIEGLAKDQYEFSRYVWVGMQHRTVMHKGMIGEVFCDQGGDVFVGGLYVCSYAGFKYSYNFNPGELTLDRDRRLASDFNLAWAASRLWGSIVDVDETVADMLGAGCDDVLYMRHHGSKQTFDYVYEKFVDLYGPDAVPVIDQEGLDKYAGTKYKAVLVPDALYHTIKLSTMWVEPKIEEGKSPAERLKAWLHRNRHLLPMEEYEAGLEILEELM